LWNTVIDDPVCLSVCLSVSRGRAGLLKNRWLDRLEVLFGMETLGDPSIIVLRGGPHPTRRGAFDTAFTKLLWLLAEYTLEHYHYHYYDAVNGLHLTTGATCSLSQYAVQQRL